MPDLVPAPFPDLVARMYAEPRVNGSLFGLPRKKWFLPDASTPDIRVRFHDKVAGNPVGPAAGPHTQMAQNLLLSYAAGSRMLELKTVQVNDQLTISRPCIDMANVGYNIEWSQELRIEQSLREYVAGMMLIEIFRRHPALAGESLSGDAGAFVFDISVGYDLAGIRSEKVQRFLDGLRDASGVIDELRRQLRSNHKLAHQIEYPKLISSTVTLSTFHGCPAHEIEKICEFLIGERDLDVIVKMNPPMLGKEPLEQLLHDVMGYTELTVNPSAYTSGLRFDEAVQLVDRMTRFADARGRRFGCKFSNTLEVLNHRNIFTPDNKVQYLSGQPLHVITMALTDTFRKAVGPKVPISFSAGVDKHNFPFMVACGFVPVTTCSDLLRPGGYGRLPGYLTALAEAMKACGATTIDQYILNAFGQVETAKRHAGADVSSVVAWAGLLNTSIAAAKAKDDPRYRAPQNRKSPRRINSHLKTFDCITCDKCIPVCPNAANFTYPTALAAFDFHDAIVKADGSTTWASEPRRFVITKEMQIACFVDFCNECGNCDTFCPEYGGPYIQKPGFFGRPETWRESKRDGFAVKQINADVSRLYGRIKGEVYELESNRTSAVDVFDDGVIRATIRRADTSIVQIQHTAARSPAEHRLDMGVYHTLVRLLEGVTDQRFVNQVNAGQVD